VTVAARQETALEVYARDLERHLHDVLFEQGALVQQPDAAAGLVRAALAAGDRSRADAVVAATERLARLRPDAPDLAMAAAHARALGDRDPIALERAAAFCRSPRARAAAAEDAGVLRAERGEIPAASARLVEARDLYDTCGSREDRDRVRTRLRQVSAGGVRAAYPPARPRGAPTTPVDEIASLRAEVDGLRLAMASRAPIEQAKGALAALGGWHPEEAWLRLVRVSQRTNLKVRDIALDILATAVRREGHARPAVVAAVRAELGLPGPAGTAAAIARHRPAPAAGDGDGDVRIERPAPGW
jgi:hypothetical protein